MRSMSFEVLAVAALSKFAASQSACPDASTSQLSYILGPKNGQYHAYNIQCGTEYFTSTNLQVTPAKSAIECERSVLFTIQYYVLLITDDDCSSCKAKNGPAPAPACVVASYDHETADSNVISWSSPLLAVDPLRYYSDGIDFILSPVAIVSS
jgi:hypothetical protein